MTENSRSGAAPLAAATEVNANQGGAAAPGTTGIGGRDENGD
jgi:hypothetical protein